MEPPDTRPSPPSPTRAVVIARGVVFVLAATFLFGGPLYKQVLHGKWKGVRGWTRYSHKGSKICLVRYHELLEGGERRQLSRIKLLGLDELRTEKRRWRHPARELNSRDDALKAGEQLCRKLGPDARVGFSMVCPRDKRWKVIEEDSGDICR